MLRSAKWVLRIGVGVVSLFVVVTLGRGYWLSFTGADAELVDYISRNLAIVATAFLLATLGIVSGVVWGVVHAAATVWEKSRTRRSKLANRAGSVLAVVGVAVVAAAFAPAGFDAAAEGVPPAYDVLPAVDGLIAAPDGPATVFTIDAASSVLAVPHAEPAQLGLDEPECGGLVGFFAWLFGSRDPRCDEDECPEKPTKNPEFAHCTWD